VTTHVPVQMLRCVIDDHGFAGEDIAEIAVDASAKVVSHHSDPNPGDIMLAQYSVPFCLAIASYYDPRDPDVFCDRTAADPRVRDLAQRVRVSADEGRKGWSARIVVSLRDGRRFEDAQQTFLGCPETPLSDEQLRFKFDRLCRDVHLKPGLFDDLMRLETLPSLADIL
jgi:2-methylcitrate dehydratase PrpD